MHPAVLQQTLCILRGKLGMRPKYSICTHPSVLERLVFAGKSSLDGLRYCVNLANS